ncbi:hypothetical protein A2Z00_04070, partial [Candidatus Gottesmanbacteria bacterium RBG_13_45_10]
QIIVQANTFIATVLPIIESGATPIFVDVDKLTGTIDVVKVRRALTKKTRAIIPVHLFGYPAPILELSKLLSLSKPSSPLWIIEDAAQAQGTTIGDKKAGSFGVLSAFSFYPGKNLGAYGDGGAVTTNSKALVEEIKILRNVGQKTKYVHTRLGTNSRLDTIQAAILLVKLKHLHAWNKKRIAIANAYREALAGCGDIITPPPTPPGAKAIYHQFVIRTQKRNPLMKFLEKRGIHCGIHYPSPLHLTPALRFLGYKRGDFPVAEERARTMLSLPMFPELDDNEIAFVTSSIRTFFRH